MIKSFASKETEKIFWGEASRRLPTDIQNVIRRKLRQINNAETINDLRISPANRLEALCGEYEGFYSIRVNSQWRIMFRFEAENAYEVQVIDYH